MVIFFPYQNLFVTSKSLLMGEIGIQGKQQTNPSHWNFSHMPRAEFLAGTLAGGQAISRLRPLR